MRRLAFLTATTLTATSLDRAFCNFSCCACGAIRDDCTSPGGGCRGDRQQRGESCQSLPCLSRASSASRRNPRRDSLHRPNRTERARRERLPGRIRPLRLRPTQCRNPYHPQPKRTGTRSNQVAMLLPSRRAPGPSLQPDAYGETPEPHRQRPPLQLDVARIHKAITMPRRLASQGAIINLRCFKRLLDLTGWNSGPAVFPVEVILTGLTSQMASRRD